MNTTLSHLASAIATALGKPLETTLTLLENWRRDPCWDLDALADQAPIPGQESATALLREYQQIVEAQQAQDRAARPPSPPEPPRQLADAKRVLTHYFSLVWGDRPRWDSDYTAEIFGIVEDIVAAAQAPLLERLAALEAAMQRVQAAVPSCAAPLQPLDPPIECDPGDASDEYVDYDGVRRSVKGDDDE